MVPNNKKILESPFKIFHLYFLEVAGLAEFSARFFQEAISPPYETEELLKQCYEVGNKSFPLVGITGFIMGVVFTLQTRPTLIEFGAVAYMPSMIGISIVREIGPVITALICAGKVGSGIGAELGSMKVTEQIDAMEVSGTKPFKFLVATRILATTLMLPILVIWADLISLFGSFLVENLRGGVSMALYFGKVAEYIEFGDLIPGISKTFFFGFAIGLVGCYKGFSSKKGTVGVGRAANSAVVVASLLVFLLDFLAVLIADIFYEL